MTSKRPALDLISHSPEQTRRLGYHLGRLVEPGDVILLFGQMGSGKTQFTQGVARGLGVEGYVQSPTFTLATEHRGRNQSGVPLTLFHIDLYRIEGSGDIETFGHEEYLDDPSGVVVIEWPERLGAALPEEYLLVTIEYVADTKRRLAFSPRGGRFSSRLEAFHQGVFGERR